MIDIRVLSRMGLLLSLSFIVWLFNDNFLNTGNIINVLRQASILNILGIGMTLTIITGGIDLSNGAVLAVSSCVAAIFLKQGFPMLLGVVTAFAIGCACGFINGWIIARLKIPPFIMTYAMMFFARGLAYLSLGGQIMYGFSPRFRSIGAGDIFGVPIPILISAAVTLIFLFVQNCTIFGSEIYAVGADEEVSRLCGVRTSKIMIWVYVLSGILSALSGIIYTSRLNAAEPVIGESFPLDAIAAVLIGGTPLKGGEGGIGGTIIGALIITVIINAMNLMGISSLLQSLVLGALILFMISTQIYFRKVNIPALYRQQLRKGS